MAFKLKNSDDKIVKWIRLTEREAMLRIFATFIFFSFSRVRENRQLGFLLFSLLEISNATPSISSFRSQGRGGGLSLIGRTSFLKFSLRAEASRWISIIGGEHINRGDGKKYHQSAVFR